jgi:hypothetical protein
VGVGQFGSRERYRHLARSGHCGQSGRRALHTSAAKSSTAQLTCRLRFPFTSRSPGVCSARWSLPEASLGSPKNRPRRRAMFTSTNGSARPCRGRCLADAPGRLANRGAPRRPPRGTARGSAGPAPSAARVRAAGARPRGPRGRAPQGGPGRILPKEAHPTCRMMWVIAPASLTAFLQVGKNRRRDRRAPCAALL